VRRTPAVLAAAFLAAAFASAARAGDSVTVGLAPDASSAAVAASLEAQGATVETRLDALDALVVSARDTGALAAAARDVPGVAYAESADVRRSLFWYPNDPLANDGEQWYVPRVRAFDFWSAAAAPPAYPPVRVAVVDSGIDVGHPEFAGRVAAARSFVRRPDGTLSPPTVDSLGHGTVIAGEIAAALDNAQGIAGVAFPAQLVVAKVTRGGAISVVAEAKGIRWAVDQGARVISLSLGGRRDPRHLSFDEYSALEHAAIDYATRHGAVVVAAAGNCPTLSCPYPYASWPAALPHVIGVAATSKTNASPAFSNRDRRYDDLAAPGTDVVSTFPRRLTAGGCAERGYSPCAEDPGWREPRGTSFSSPLAAAATALVLAQQPLLTSEQAAAIVERAAVDIGTPGRDPASGRGLLDVNGALAAPPEATPPADVLEPNDDAGTHARPLRGTNVTVTPTLDWWDDARDVYRVYLAAGQRGTFTLTGATGANMNLYLWPRHTDRVGGLRWLAASRSPGADERISFRPRQAGRYFLEVRLASHVGGRYTLTVTKS
jgi:subtilisin family serine protease